MSSNGKKGFWAGYKKLGPTSKFMIRIAVLSLILVVIFFLISYIQQQQLIDIIKQVLNKSKLEEISPLGYAGFGIKGNTIIVPTGFIPKGFDVNWETGEVIKNNPKSVEILLPEMLVNTKYDKNKQLYGNRTILDKKVGFNTGNLFGFRNYWLYCEVMGFDEDKDLLTIGIGFAERKKRIINK